MVDKCVVLESFLADKEERLSKRTIEQYTLAILSFLKFYPEDEIELVTQKHFKQWTRQLAHCGYKANSIISFAHAVKTFSQYLLEEGLIKESIAYGTDLPVADEMKPRLIDDSTLFRIFEASKDNIRDRTLLQTLLDTGVRAGEVGLMTIANIDKEYEKIYIPPAKGTIGRDVFYTDKCGKLIDKYLCTRSDNNPSIFITRGKRPFTRQSVHGLVAKYVYNAGIEEPISPHWFRHTFATKLLERECPPEIVASLLGHADLRYISKYMHLSSNVLKQAYDQYR